MKSTGDRLGWSPARLAVAFYATAAAGAAIGQVWVAMTHIPWPDGLPVGWRLAAVLPFAVCLELLAMVLAAMADQRMRMGERALGFRVFSAAVAVLAVGIIVAGHWGDPYTVAAFGGLSVSAYLLWLLHSAARRRDALRAAGRLAEVAPSYGLVRWLRHPVWTARAAELARERGLGVYESLRAAEQELRAARRRPAIAAAVEQAIRAEHPDPRMAQIAVTTLDLDRIARELERAADYAGWAARLAPAVTAPPSDMSGRRTGHGTGHEAHMGSGHGADTGADAAPDITRREADMSGSSKRTSSGRRRTKKAARQESVSADDLLELMAQRPDITQKQLAELVGLSDRQVRRILKSATASGPDMSGPEAGRESAGHDRVNGHPVSA